MSCTSFTRNSFLSVPRFIAAIFLFALVAAAGLSEAVAQESLRSAVYGGTATEHKKPAKKTEAVKKVSPGTKKPAVQRRRAGSTASAKKAGLINVVFESKDPKTQVYLNGNHIGATDENRTFRRMITPGTYRVRGVLGINIVFPERLVQLGTDGVKMTLYEEVAEKPPEKKEEAPLVIPKTEAEKEMELAREMSAEVIRIFSDFLDPEKSAAITIADWRFAANAAVLGEFQNLSKQQIEAQRKFAAGQIALAEKDYKKAFAEFRLAIQSFPTSPLPHIGLGDAYSASAMWQEARKAYEQAKVIGPHLWITHRRLGDIYRKLGEKKRAVLAYAEAIKSGDNRYETRFLRARAMVDAQEMQAAVPLLEELAKEEPRSEVFLSLGEAYEFLRRNIGALDHYRKAVELDPESPVAQYMLARIYFTQREFKKAVDGFDAALKLDGDKKSFPHEDAAKKRTAALGQIKTTSK